ncbi:Phosphopantothenoylcysteine decarboxylase / Phosphopantothenoylcysteine synthetase [Helicobacter heilmannii]|uniref:Coenzyme A biosynthesis bifunctional protein CoaBC n=1 Tax=Helicobacter heilmannii TaxID=35817 RepID=A0A0K2XV94_HELHE|nr:bifunctional phosphopantothenoylcysteine decarboxylase/phosphopantothenate--cysteine ligase CoaBC [Helicobacter heilmannii]BDQ27089.1 phosphopantothenate synthase [Helicobacter heilmannii]CCM12030.1 Phosphopantothenoylcysteine decarboxylase [Helicobacter heilmannii ASB1.4]CRF50017.1 Phosphopantothenoylcysteine decarboxylase / Phosphopantothenoylcysteine synthetase [Helicobacter heilmannii]CRI34339.1 Phosphopantothenoylcysteine decarboxylase / Phosphopantothenoylcysteine synthetase [Helicobac
MPSSLDQIPLLENKNILLLVSGSIAAYKALDLLHLLRKMGASVRVVMSQGACKFVQPLSFEALSHFKVLIDHNEEWTLLDQDCANHISYAQSADLILVAPASANTLAKLAHGLADNALSATFLASPAPKVLAPAMNTQMFLAKQTQRNLKCLKALGCEVVEPKDGLLACNSVGVGALAEVSEIASTCARKLLVNDFWAGKKAVVTGGGSIEAIDSVRCVSNFSSGLQAHYLALALWLKGAQVVLISSKNALELPSGVERVKVQSANDYLEALKTHENPSNPPFLFMLAAISDYKPKNRHEGKLKKQDLGAFWSVECVQNVDILQELGGFYKVAFKAESDTKHALENAKKLLEPTPQGKGCKLVCLNDTRALGSDTNQLTLLTPKTTHTTPKGHKLQVSFEVLDFIEKMG